MGASAELVSKVFALATEGEPARGPGRHVPRAAGRRSRPKPPLPPRPGPTEGEDEPAGGSRTTASGRGRRRWTPTLERGRREAGRGRHRRAF